MFDMIFEQGEYEISEDGKKITITKECLEEWRNHYDKVRKHYGVRSNVAWMYLGKTDVFVDLLKMFEPLEG